MANINANVQPKEMSSDKKSKSFNIYIYNTMKQTRADIEISKKAMSIANELVMFLFEQLAEESVRATHRSTMRWQSVKTATSLVFPEGELKKHALMEGDRAMHKYVYVPVYRGNVKKTWPERIGVSFPVGRIKRYLTESFTGKRVDVGAAIYVAAVLEYIVAEVMELSGQSAIDNKTRRINPRDIYSTCCHDEELRKLFKNASILQGRVCR